MKYIVVDLEMNPVSRKNKIERRICKNEVIEIGAVVLDEQFKEISSFMTYVKPQFNEKIEEKIESLTGITTEMVENAPRFEDAFNMFVSFCQSIQGEYEICEWSDNDRRQLEREVNLKEIILSDHADKILKSFVDFQEEFGVQVGMENNRIGLSTALSYAGIDFVGRQHDALYDARNTAELLTIARVEEKRTEALERIIDIMHPTTLTSAIGDLIDFSAFQIA